MIGWNFLKVCHSRLLEKMATYFGYPERILRRSIFDATLCGITTWTLFYVGSIFWPADRLIVSWLFALTLWAFLHIRKSSTTWSRFDEIDERDLDFHNSIDRQIEMLQSKITLMESTLRPEVSELDKDNVNING